jgi:hypothetical protein
MMIAMARFTQRFGLTSVGVQYQQGWRSRVPPPTSPKVPLVRLRVFPIPDETGNIIRAGKPIPCINEVDMGTAIPQTMLWRLLDALGLPSETTLHDIRWGSVFEGTFYWDLEISGSVPFEHLKGGIAGCHRLPSARHVFPHGWLIHSWTGQGRAPALGACALRGYTGHSAHRHRHMRWSCRAAEFERRRRATTYEWPLLNCVLDGVGRDDLMAGHQSNHITIAYVDEDKLQDVLRAFVAQAITQNIKVLVAGSAVNAL